MPMRKKSPEKGFLIHGRKVRFAEMNGKQFRITSEKEHGYENSYMIDTEGNVYSINQLSKTTTYPNGYEYSYYKTKCDSKCLSINVDRFVRLIPRLFELCRGMKYKGYDLYTYWDWSLYQDDINIYFYWHDGLKAVKIKRMSPARGKRKDSYPKVILWSTKTCTVHRLCCDTWYHRPLPSGVSKSDWKRTPKSVKNCLDGGNYWQVNHIDEDHDNYHPSNLEWMSGEENRRAYYS